ncbi:MAG: radical SAM protein [Deltaproteobacteria bacterium]|nr:radical SAM protein [Deltaproteobacteria bacterium]
MRIDLVIAPFYLADEFDKLLPTAAIGCIQAELHRCGHEVLIHDLRLGLRVRNHWSEYLNPVQSWVMEAPQLRLMDRLRRKFAAGASLEALLVLEDDDVKAILDLSMDLCTSPFENLETYRAIHRLLGDWVDKFRGSQAVVFTTAIYTNLYSNFLLALLIKRRYPEIPTIIGGPSIYQSPRLARYLATTGAFDALAMGDAEPILDPLLDTLLHGRDLATVPGIIPKGRAKHDFVPIPPTNISQLPPPDFSGLDLSAYLPFTLPIHSARGCPYRCRYCSEHRESFVHMPVAQVIRDIKVLKAKHHTRFFFFCDSLLNGDREWFWELCDALQDCEVRWIAYLRLGGKQPLTQAQVDRMVRAGAFMIRMGVDSVEPLILRDMARPQNVPGILAEIEMIRESGIQVDANLISGFPGESRETVLNTIYQVSQVTRRSDRIFGKAQRSFFQVLADKAYNEMPIELLASVLVNLYPFQVRPGSRMYDAPERDGLVYQYHDPDRFGYPVEEPTASLIRQIPESFQGPVPSHEILQRIRVLNRALHQPCESIPRVRAMAINLWLHAHCLEPEDCVGPLQAPRIFYDDDGNRTLYIAAVAHHLPLTGGLRLVVDHLLQHNRATVGELLELGPPKAVRNAVALLICAGILSSPERTVGAAQEVKVVQPSATSCH